jgi:hypothetical protein
LAAGRGLSTTNSPFTTRIITFVFPPYFQACLVKDPVAAQSIWGYAIAGSGLVIAVLALRARGHFRRKRQTQTMDSRIHLGEANAVAVEMRLESRFFDARWSGPLIAHASIHSRGNQYQNCGPDKEDSKIKP